MNRPDPRAELLAGIPYDPDPLAVTEDDLVERWHPGTGVVLIERPRALRAALLAGLLGVALGFLLANATLAAGPAARSEPHFEPVRIPAATEYGLSPLPVADAPSPSTAGAGGPTSMPGQILDPAVPTQPIPRAQPDQPAAVAVTVSTASGIASTYGPGYDGLTASRWPRGTVLVICGAGGCETRTTNDYGPDGDVFPERIVDVDVATFEAVCGYGWRRGTCPVTVTLL